MRKCISRSAPDFDYIELGVCVFIVLMDLNKIPLTLIAIEEAVKLFAGEA